MEDNSRLSLIPYFMSLSVLISWKFFCFTSVSRLSWREFGHPAKGKKVNILQLMVVGKREICWLGNPCGQSSRSIEHAPERDSVPEEIGGRVA